MHAKLPQLCLTLGKPMGHSLADSSVHGFSRQEQWSGLPCLPPGNLPNLGIEATSLTSSALSGRFFTTSATWEAQKAAYLSMNTSLAVIVALADSCVKSSSPRQVPDGQERH